MIERPTNVTKAEIKPEKRIISEEPHELKEALEHFWNHKQELYQAAYAMQRKVIEEGLSYRNFGVGAAAVVWKESDNSFKIITGWNEKEAKGIPKHCAEMKIYEQAESEGYDRVVGIVIVADHQEDPSQVKCTTLHPCRECRNVIRTNKLTWTNMPIVTMSIPPDVDFNDLGEYSPVEEQHTVSDLLFEHDNGLHNQGVDPTIDKF